MDSILNNEITKGMALAGAGGGGFLYILTKKPNSKNLIQQLVDHLDMKTYDAKIAPDGIELSFY
jgi:galactokinase/mevalonate kinase-like predicted kinase